MVGNNAKHGENIQMNTEQQYLLVEEVFMYCNFSMVNFREFEELIKIKYSYKLKGIWYNLQTALTNAAIISSYIFSNKISARERTAYLQKVLMVTEDSSSLKNKLARNYLTHIDEKFDYCINNSTEFKGIIETVVSNRKEFELFDNSSYFIRRAIIKDEMVFIFQLGDKKQEFKLTPLINELTLIHKNCSRYLKKLKSSKTTKYVVFTPR